MAQWLNAPVLGEDPGPVASTRMAANSSLELQFQGI